ncbi:hypothetical protein [Geomicrobium sp. JCM 19039]|uniref:hypothetical protein n=1 Tax=Geomicrobium sp. JCM 19039 TaxID=1460636 RepID=UPI00045F4342|nr:hypothetical protein [Geomicrobium sp. JCM 19039]GAK12549.1 hypothetical protein JCM19039_2331 [Geomicrobium sp. JCM 19039]
MKWLDVLFPLAAVFYLIAFDWQETTLGILAAIAILLVASLAVTNMILRITQKRKKT